MACFRQANLCGAAERSTPRGEQDPWDCVGPEVEDRGKAGSGYRKPGAPTSVAARAFSIWPFRRRSDGPRQAPPLVKELRIATSAQYSIKASIESLRVDGAGSHANGGRVRAALFSPLELTTIHFHTEEQKKQGNPSARASALHVLQMFTPAETASILDDAKRIGAAIGWSDRGVSLPTQDVLVQNLSKESQDAVHRAIRAAR